MPRLSLQVLLCWEPKECILKPWQRLCDLIRALERKSGDIHWMRLFTSLEGIFYRMINELKIYLCM